MLAGPMAGAHASRAPMRTAAPRHTSPRSLTESVTQGEGNPPDALRETIPMPNLDPQTVQLAIVAGVALALLLQTIFLLAILVTVRKSARSLKEEVEDLRSSVMPLIYNARELFVRVAPKVEDTAADLSAMAHGLREQTEDVQRSAAEILERVRAQMERLDSAVSCVFEAVNHATGFVTETVAKPMRQLSGILASAKAIVESLRESAGPHGTHIHSEPVQDDKDLFF